MFHRQRKSTLSAQAKPVKDLMRHVTAAQFLLDNKRQNLIHRIRELSGLEASRYESLCNVLLENMVDYCQSLPETANSYYSQPGGVMDYALNRTEAALSLFKEFIVLDKSGILSEEQLLWQYALYSAAVLQGIGKLCLDYRIHVYDANGQQLKQWNPLLERLIDTGTYYDYEFQKEADQDFRRRLNLLLARTLMPVSGFNWIASQPQVLAVWLALLNEDPRSAGTLGAILIRADALAIQRYINEFMVKAGVGRGGRYGLAGPFAGGVPASLAEKEMAMGIEFIQWLTNALAEGRIMINKAPLYMVPGGMLMTQEMFQFFVREHPEYKNWQAVQNGFLSLGLHRHAVAGSVTGRFEQAHTQRMETGVVFSEFAVALPSTVQVYQFNTGKIEPMSAIDLIHKAPFTSQFTQQHNTQTVTPLHKLSASGLWQAIDSEAPHLGPGVRGGV
ncbi:conjugal transfer nickase/helicase domain-containing protein [Legionella worsleiensis]|uniref:Putative helicase/relaxase n=1 Tax=Legionella worsleiensis TaxID=45076 RepID=A0A0W1AF08_9GAMM|nr:TraI domain-containing protein [Legionella worsleiensis]KTD79744.1 putative helicase/relaxase [Legionella worsleiensis]STY32255.1 putative helicase/relaxase [Legionella worsleiensis]